MSGFWEYFKQFSDDANAKQNTLYDRQFKLLGMNAEMENANANRVLDYSKLLQSGLEGQGKLGGDILAADLDLWKAQNRLNFDYYDSDTDAATSRYATDIGAAASRYAADKGGSSMDNILGLLGLALNLFAQQRLNSGIGTSIPVSPAPGGNQN